MVHSCHDLEQYVQFLELVEEARAAGHKHPLRWAIQEAVRRNILRDYLERKGGEVLSILMTEYDYATDMAVLKEEAYEDGLETARAMLAIGITNEQVQVCTGLPLERVLLLQQEQGIRSES